ncbi:hypothetical protein IWW57_004897 [Coemansia sp. S610]|nr:hypothetical protein IWW57_004897 [Coemansia sp. S610]
MTYLVEDRLRSRLGCTATAAAAATSECFVSDIELGMYRIPFPLRPSLCDR